MREIESDERAGTSAYGAVSILHAVEPLNWGRISNPDGRGRAETGGGEAFITVDIRLSPDRSHVEQARFEAEGPPALVAAGSVATELMKGLSPVALREISATHLHLLLGGIPPNRQDCITLCLEAVHRAGRAARISLHSSTRHQTVSPLVGHAGY